jgi:hypothetical protein
METKFWFGVPIRYFEQVLLFQVVSVDPRCRRTEFPSWSWTGWNQRLTGVAGLSCERWKLLQTNQTYRPEGFRSMTSWYRFNCFSEGSAVLNQLDGIDYPGAKEALANGPPSRKFMLPCNLQPHHMLVFDSTVLLLGVYHHTPGKHQRSNVESYGVYLPVNRPESKPRTGDMSSNLLDYWKAVIGSGKLDSSWRRRQGNIFEFVAIAEETFLDSPSGDRFSGEHREVIHTLLVETIMEVDSVRICRRIQAFTLDKSTWEMASPHCGTYCLI